MWAEIMQKDNKEAVNPPLNILPEPVEEYELRLVIYKTRDIENMDWEGCSDIFVRAFLNPDDDRLTDTHWRC